MTDLPQASEGLPDQSLDQTYEDNLEDELGGGGDEYFGEEGLEDPENFYETNPNDISGYDDGQAAFENEF
jgi:hypothetical protein